MPPPHRVPADELISTGYSGWWSRGWGLMKAAWRPLAALQLMLAGVSLVLVAPLSAWGIYLDVRGTVVTEANVGAEFGVLGQRTAENLLGLLVGMTVLLAVVHVVVGSAHGRTPTALAAIRAAVPRLPAVLGWGLIAVMIALAGACACVLPGVYFLAVFTILPVVIAVERISPIGRCFQLFHANLGVAVGRVATIVALSLAVIPAAALGPATVAVMGAFGAGIDGHATLIVGGVVGAVASLLASAAIGMLTGPLTVAAYADMRARCEPVSAAQIRYELTRR